MRFGTIWTLAGATFGEKMRRSREWLAQVIAIRLPQRIRYWVTIQNMSLVASMSPHDKQHPMSITVEDVLTRMPKPKERA